MKQAILLPLFLWLAVSNSFAAPSIKVKTEKNSSIYRTGEAVEFQVQVVGAEGAANSTVDYVLSEDGFKEIRKGKLKLKNAKGSIEGIMNTPGFLRCVVSFTPQKGKTLRGVAAAAISPLKIAASLPAPEDFDSFWKSQKSKLEKVAMKATLTPVENARANCFDVQITCVGKPVSGYLGLPKESKPKSLPIILWVHGAGVRSSSLGNAVQGAEKGMISMDINAHGIPNGKPGKFYSDLNSGELKGYRHAGREDRETIYFKNMYLRLVRALDYLTALPEWDGKTVAVVGHSQGGLQALVAGSLDSRVTFIGSGVPAGCDHTGAAVDRISGWPKIVPTVNGKPDPKISKASRYIDAVNFASRCKAEAIMSVGFIDPVCPPTSCYAAYNQLKGPKTVLNEPTMAHAGPAHIKQAFLEALIKHSNR